MKVFVAGATGETGRRVVRQLVSRNIPTRALVRNLETARQMLPPETELVVGNVLDAKSLPGLLGDSTAVICATGARPNFDMTGPYRVDYEGTRNLIDAAKGGAISHFVLITSLCVSQFFHPLNLYGLILVWKKQAEDYLKQSGLKYTIVRPGGLRNEDTPFPLVMRPADQLFEGSIPREKVAQVCVESLFQPSAGNKIVEIVSRVDAPKQTFEELFANVPAQ